MGWREEAEIAMRKSISTSHGHVLERAQVIPAVYTELDKLETTGFAIGFDLLPNEIPQSNFINPEMFSGRYHSS